MDDLTGFEERLTRRMRADAEVGVTPFDARSIVEAVVRRQRSFPTAGWFPLPAARFQIAFLLGVLVVVAALAFGPALAPIVFGPRSTPHPTPSPAPNDSPEPSPTGLSNGTPAPSQPSPLAAYSQLIPATVELPEGASASSLSTIVEFRGGYVALGTAQFGDQPEGVAWTSGDGGRWALEQDYSGFDPPHGFVPSAANDTAIVVVTGGRAVAVSTDGKAWRQLDAPAHFSVVAALPDLFVAYGNSSMWTSRDGTAWKRVADEATFGSASFVRLRVLSVGGQPTLFAIGNGIWTSSDGAATEWHKGALGFTRGNVGVPVGVDDVGQSADGFLAAGWAAYCCYRLTWTSTDAAFWREVDADADRGWLVEDLVGAPSGFLATTRYGEAANSRLWFTELGNIWTALPEALGPAGGGATVRPLDLLIRPDGAAIVVGNEYESGAPRAFLAWVAR